MAIATRAQLPTRMQVRIMLRASETVLGDAGSDWELMVTEDTEDVQLGEVTAIMECESKADREWSWGLRRSHLKEDAELRSETCFVSYSFPRHP